MVAPYGTGTAARLDVDMPLREVSACKALIVPGFVPDGSRRPPDLRDLAETAAWVRHRHARGALACGSCSGVFLLGEAGLLDGRRCTTTWWLHDEMKHRYPRADAAWGAALVEDRRVVTAGGPLSWIDLALHVVRVAVRCRGGTNRSGLRRGGHGSFHAGGLHSGRPSGRVESAARRGRADCPPGGETTSDRSRSRAAARNLRTDAPSTVGRGKRRVPETVHRPHPLRDGENFPGDDDGVDQAGRWHRGIPR